MIGIGNESTASLQSYTRTGQRPPAGSQNLVPSQAALAGGDSVNIGNLFASFAGQVKTMFDGQEGPSGARELGVAEFSMRVSVKETFEGRYSNFANGDKTSAYVRQTKETSAFMSFNKAQADSVLEAQMNAMNQDPFSPEATASRIASFALGFFPMFAADNPDMTYEQQVTAFEQMVDGAVSQGFSEALAILGNMPDEVSNQINDTMNLVRDKLSSFFDNMRGEGADAAKAASQNGNWKDYVTEFYKQETEDEPLTT